MPIILFWYGCNWILELYSIETGDDLCLLLLLLLIFEQELFEFNNFSPGSEKGYTLQFEGNSNGKYLFNFHFNEIGNGELKKYLNVGIKMNGEVVYECSLMELLSGQNNLSFELKILRKEIVEFELIYLMPESIGNEAQNALGKFNLLVSIKEQK